MLPSRTDPGGKGINVSKVVAALGSTSRALGILGGSTGQMISEALSGLNMTCDFLPVEGNTRINLKVVDPIAHTSTEINEPGVPVDPATLQSLLDHLLKLLRHDDIVVLAGSLPGECSCRHLPRVGRCLPRKRCQGHSGL